MRKWILYLIIAYIIASIMTGCNGCNNSFNNLIGNGSFGGGSGSGGSGGSGYSLAIGELDTSFNGTGIVVHHNAAGGNSNDFGNSIYVGSDSKIYVTGRSINSSGNTDMVIWRYNSNGTLDTSFGNNGIVVHNNAAGGNSNDVGDSIFVDSTGKIYVTGFSFNGSNYDMVIWRYNSNGTLDTSFGNNGIVVHNNAAGGNGHDVGDSIFVDSTGKIYVTGSSFNGSNYDMVIWRYK